MKAKSDKRTGKIQRIMSIVEAMSDARLDALLLFLDVKPEKEYEFTEEENNLVSERIARYERGESKGMLAEEASGKIRAILQKKRK